jgi:hypothetical protein
MTSSAWALKRAGRLAAGCLTCGGTIRGNQRWCSECLTQRHRLQTIKSHTRKQCQKCGRTARRGPLCGKCSKAGSRKLKPCPACSALFWPWADGAAHARKYCGSTCVRSAMATAQRQRERPPSAPKPIKTYPILKCQWCLVEFQSTGHRLKYCSARCQQVSNWRRKKARRRGATGILPATPEIYLRDGGICQICKKRVPRHRKFPHPQFATLDHIVPITKGGTNDAVNIQLAHFRCNTAKGPRQRHDQQRLFG